MNRDTGGETGFYTATRADLVLILLILVLSVFFIAGNVFRQAGLAFSPRQVLVYHDKELLRTADLSRDATFKVLGGKITVEVRGGRVRVAEADCPQHICMLAGWKKDAGDTIVCVPNRVLIEIKSAAPSHIDAVSY